MPESAGPRLYRTGDWGYLLSSGMLEICGRCDTMVKIRGYSIETQVGIMPPLMGQFTMFERLFSRVFFLLTYIKAHCTLPTPLITVIV